MLPIVWSRTARVDLQGIVRYFIANHRDPVAGRRIYDEIIDRVEQPAAGILVGHSHPDAPASWLYVQHKRWLIFYRVDEFGLYVMRVVDAVRDLPSLLSEAD